MYVPLHGPRIGYSVCCKGSPLVELLVDRSLLPTVCIQVDDVRDTFRSILQMSLVLTYGGSVPIVKVRSVSHDFRALWLEISCGETEGVWSVLQSFLHRE